ncbi:hypothetical protein LAL4801_03828 [Roseibium aggregatum]|uniref:Uncharacterized protein n=1 Tax=Roseibium aggregatum TaxID=187304 RepID=A0A0M6Y6U6_9HYPH|nr:hypothetical protein LAL4801_03828 [Roseibium aggregatum]
MKTSQPHMLSEQCNLKFNYKFARIYKIITKTVAKF